MQIKNRNWRRKGFTLVELSLSIAFIAVLSIIVVVVVMNAISSYRRGLVLNQLNTVGMGLIDDIRSTIRQTPGAGDKNATSFKSNDGKYGAICVGTYSYLWNNPEGGVKVTYTKKGGGSETIEKGKLLKIEDVDRKVCHDGKNNNNPIVVNKEYEFEAPIDLIAKTDSSLSIYDMTIDVVKSGNKSNNDFYYISFTLGTDSGGIVNASNCSAPENNGSGGDFDSCAINKFNFAVQAIGSNR